MACDAEPIRFVYGVERVSGPPGSGATCGRFAVAGAALARGSVVMRAPALAVVLHEQGRGRRCDWCLTTASGEAPLRCGRCRAVYYCDRRCQEADWRDGHQAECRARSALAARLAAEGLPGQDAMKDALLAARCLRRSATGPSGRLQESRSSGPSTDLESIADRLEAVERDQLRHMARAIARCDPPLHPPTAETEVAAFDVLSRFRNNNFAVVDDLFIPIGAGCFPKGAALNHSCAPNCLLTYELEKGKVPVQVVRAMQDIRAGEELTQSYVDLALPTWERKAQLREVYGFDCACSACSSECDRELALADTLMDKAAAEEDGEQELRLLAEVCRVREAWLHPLHVEVAAAHAAAHTAAVAAGAWDEARLHCKRLVEQYLAVYPPWHPITGLQMYTLAELEEKAGRASEAREFYERAGRVLSDTHGPQHGMVRDLQDRLREMPAS